MPDPPDAARSAVQVTVDTVGRVLIRFRAPDGSVAALQLDADSAEQLGRTILLAVERAQSVRKLGEEVDRTLDGHGPAAGS